MSAKKLTADMTPEEYVTRAATRTVEQGLRQGSKATVSKVTLDYANNIVECAGTVGRRQQHGFILFLNVDESMTAILARAGKTISRAKQRRAKKVLDKISQPLTAKE